MPVPSLRCNKGFTYLAALIIVIIMGIMLGAMGQSWTMLMKREREAELFFRGNQIKEAIGQWRTPKPGQPPNMPLKDLKDLLKDPRTMSNVRYLRQLYNDPITGKEWNVIRDPQRGIIGVASTSEDKPLKQSGFPIGYETFEGKTKYSEWLFVYGQAPPQLSISGATGGTLPVLPTGTPSGTAGTTTGGQPVTGNGSGATGPTNAPGTGPGSDFIMGPRP